MRRGYGGAASAGAPSPHQRVSELGPPPHDADRATAFFAPPGTASSDVLVRPHHGEMIYKAYSGDKNLVSFGGDHNELRPSFFIDSAIIFLSNVLNLHDEMRLEVNLVFLQILHTHSPCPVYSPLYPTRPSSSDPLGPPVTPH